MTDDLEAAFKQFVESFAHFKDLVQQMDAIANQLNRTPVPIVDETHLGLARSLLAIETSTFQMLANWPTHHIDFLGEILEFFQHATIGRVTVRELMDIVQSEQVTRN